MILRRKYAKLRGNLGAPPDKYAVFHGQIAEQSRMERGPIRTANGEHWGERGDFGIKQKLNHGWNGFSRIKTRPKTKEG